jgi:hypothetical protein
VRRAADNFATVRSRLQACLPQATGSTHEALRAALAEASVHATRVPSGDRDALEDGVAAAGRAARALQQYCPPSDFADRALAIIAALHAGAP